VAQAVCRRLLNLKDWVESQARPCWNYFGPSATEIVLSRVISVFDSQYNYTDIRVTYINITRRYVVLAITSVVK
jgi:hypothetical protein